MADNAYYSPSTVDLMLARVWVAMMANHTDGDDDDWPADKPHGAARFQLDNSDGDDTESDDEGGFSMEGPAIDPFADADEDGDGDGSG